MAKAKTVRVLLSCVYAGFEGDPGPGDVIEIDAEEADRLIGLGVATVAVESAGAAKPTGDTPTS